MNASLKKVAVALGLGLGSGLAPKAPGTAGSVAALLFFPFMVWVGLPASIVFCVMLCLIGIPICQITAEHFEVHDDGRIVFDEWAGQAIALLPLLAFDLNDASPVTFGWVLASFGLFRLFDVTKPWPISWLDRQVSGGLGIMVDDIVAGAIAALVLCALISGFNGSAM